MIRLGSLGGYPFEGPRVLGGWTPPTTAEVYAITYRPDPVLKPQDFAVIYVGHSDDLSGEGFPFRHPHAACWTKRAGNQWNIHICTYEVPGGLRSHREQISRELIAVYRPGCNPDQFDLTWEDHWIGRYNAPTTNPLTTRRTP
jgi:hypothetical protein